MKFEKNYAIIETAEDAAALGRSRDFYAKDVGLKATHPEVLEALTPKDLNNDPLFGIMKYPAGVEYIRYFPNGIGGELLGAARLGVFEIFKANAITTGRTVGELRELLAWAQGEK